MARQDAFYETTEQREAAWRRRNTAALEQVRREVSEKYPSITAENAAEVLKWQEARWAELMEAARW